MKKYIILILVVLAVFTIGFYSINKQKRNSEMKNYIIKGTIYKINSNDSFILEANNSQYIIYYDKITELDVNKNVVVTYDGSILESLPAQIYATSVDIIN